MWILCVLSQPNLAVVPFSHFILPALSLCLFVCLKLSLNSDEQRFEVSPCCRSSSLTFFPELEPRPVGDPGYQTSGILMPSACEVPHSALLSQGFGCWELEKLHHRSSWGALSAWLLGCFQKCFRRRNCN